MKRTRFGRPMTGDSMDELLEVVQAREENVCFFLEHFNHLCCGDPQACHLISQSVLKQKFSRGAVWREVTVHGEDGSKTTKSLYLPVGRFELITDDDDFVSLEQICADRRNAVFGCEWIHSRFDRRVAEAVAFEVPRECLPTGFEAFVREFGLAGEAAKRFPFDTYEQIHQPIEEITAHE